MQYFISFLEGIITFVSPCLLPMLPVYVSYFAGDGESSSPRRTLRNALGFVLGFTAVFVLMGALAGTLGSLLRRYETAVNVGSGLVVIVFGLNYLGVFRLNLFRGIRGGGSHRPGFWSALLFGVIFSVGWTPCVGAFLGSALLLAGQQGQALAGIVMLLLYSAGLGIPFLLSAVLIDRLKSAFDAVKRHYSVINRASGALLVLVGVLMMTGTMGQWLALLS